jgi:hypothetical protein
MILPGWGDRTIDGGDIPEEQQMEVLGVWRLIFFFFVCPPFVALLRISPYHAFLHLSAYQIQALSAPFLTPLEVISCRLSLQRNNSLEQPSDESGAGAELIAEGEDVVG